MESEDTERIEDRSPPKEQEQERADDARSRALVPVSRRRAWRDPGPKLMAGLCYFAWLGWITAPVPLLLLNSSRMLKARRVPYHLFAAVGWSTLIVGIRAVFWVMTTWLDISQWVHAEAVSNFVRLTDLVVVLSFALLLSCWWALEALLGRELPIAKLSDWARGRADHFLGRD
ncbi:MAG: hypothetical protein R6V07_16740 [Armatimonadota bacterium]